MKSEKTVVPIKPRGQYDAGKPSKYHMPPPRSRSPSMEYAATGKTLRDWARQLADNSSIISAVLSSRVSNGISAGLTYEPLVKDKKGNLLVELNTIIRRIHEKWSKKADVTGTLSRAEIERLGWRTWDVDGELFARQVQRSPVRRGLEYSLQMIETEWIPDWLTEKRKDEYIVHGIGHDKWGVPIRYYIVPEQYDYSRPQKIGGESSVPADQMIHLRRVRRPNQIRGVTLFHSVIFRVADIAEYQQSHRLAARASADLFASINRSPDYDADTADDPEKPRTFEFERLTVLDELAAGESVNFHTPQHPNQNAIGMVDQEQRQICAACDVGFSQVGQVFDSSYAAQRLEVVDIHRKTGRDRRQFIDDFARPALYEKVIETARLKGLLPQRLLRRADLDTLLDCRIDGPPMPVIDPVKDRKANEMDQNNRWDSRHGIIRQRGADPTQVDAEILSDSNYPDEPADDATNDATNAATTDNDT